MISPHHILYMRCMYLFLKNSIYIITWEWSSITVSDSQNTIWFVLRHSKWARIGIWYCLSNLRTLVVTVLRLSVRHFRLKALFLRFYKSISLLKDMSIRRKFDKIPVYKSRKSFTLFSRYGVIIEFIFLLWVFGTLKSVSDNVSSQLSRKALSLFVMWNKKTNFVFVRYVRFVRCSNRNWWYEHVNYGHIRFQWPKINKNWHFYLWLTQVFILTFFSSMGPPYWI